MDEKSRSTQGLATPYELVPSYVREHVRKWEVKIKELHESGMVASIWARTQSRWQQWVCDQLPLRGGRSDRLWQSAYAVYFYTIREVVGSRLHEAEAKLRQLSVHPEEIERELRDIKLDLDEIAERYPERDKPDLEGWDVERYEQLFAQVNAIQKRLSKLEEEQPGRLRRKQTIGQAKEALHDMHRVSCYDPSFGDTEIYWYDQENHCVAGGYLASIERSEIRFYLSLAHLGTYKGELAQALAGAGECHLVLTN